MSSISRLFRALLVVRRFGLVSIIGVVSGGCAASEGNVFSFPDSGLTDTGQGSTEVCDDLPNFLEGNDATLGHGCGYSCDSDWCNCDPCLAQDGPGIAMSEGNYVLTFIGGATDPITYEFEAFDRTDGRSLAREQIRYVGFFDHMLRFAVPSGCHEIDFLVRQVDPFCSRLYETFIDRE